MNILGIMGSSRRDGNTNDLLDVALKAASDHGANVEKIVLLDYKIHHIYNCKDCQARGFCEPDDFPLLRDKIFAADGIIWATPVYWYTVSSLTKVLLDRLCCPLYLETPEKYLEKMRGKAAAVITTLEESFEYAAHLLGTMKMIINYEFNQWIDLGYVIARGGSRGTALKDETAVKKAYDLGKRIALFKITA